MGEDVIKFKNGKAELNLVNNQKYIAAHNFFTDMINKDKSAYPTTGKPMSSLPAANAPWCCPTAILKPSARPRV